MNSHDNERLARIRVLHAMERASRTLQVSKVKADINVTPLVDVVLVLLIIFMVVTPLIARGIAVDLPKTVHHSGKPDDGKDIVVSITQNEQIYVGTRRVSQIRDLAGVVAAERRKFPSKSVFLKCDSRVRYGSAREAMTILHAANIRDVMLGTETLTRNR